MICNNMPVWKVCIVQPRSRLRSFDVPYIFYSKFSKSRARNLQTFQSGQHVSITITKTTSYNKNKNDNKKS